MAAKRRVRHLAKHLDLPVSDTLDVLIAAGLNYHRSEDQMSERAWLIALSFVRSDLEDVHAAPHDTKPYTSAPSSEHPQQGPAIIPAKPRQGTLYYTPPSKPRIKTVGPLRHQYDWPIVGNPPGHAIHHLDAAMVIKIHEFLVEEFRFSDDPINPSGTRDKGELLESALGRPSTSLGATLKYPTVEMASAALLHALIHNHPFTNGNKRTAIVAFLVFLDLNGYVLTCSDDELFKYVLALSSHENLDVNSALSISDGETVSAARWTKSFTRKISKIERQLSWRQLRAILFRFECVVENRSGNSVAIKRGLLVSHAGYRNDGDEIDGGTIAKIRKELELDEAHGIDSNVFYYEDSVISDFINEHRQILARLAAY